MPRPLRLERILTVVAMMGVGRVILIDAEKVEKDFFGSHLFRNPQEVKKCFVEGIILVLFNIDMILFPVTVSSVTNILYC